MDTKTLYLFGILYMLPILLSAQNINLIAEENVTITDAGVFSTEASAILDIQSTLGNKGVLIPRLTSTQRQNIPSPALGLMVFDTTTESFWYNSSTGWTEIGGDSNWGNSGNNIFNTNVGNVGIGTNTPPSLLTVGSSTTEAALHLGHIGSFNNANSGRLIFDEDIANLAGTCGFELQHNGSQDKLSLISGCILPITGDTVIVFNRNGIVNIKNSLMLGSKDAFPTEVLDVDGQIRMREGAMNGYIPVSNANGVMVWRDPGMVSGVSQTLSLSGNDISISGGNTIAINQISDIDDNTKIQVEETSNENRIRFDAGGIEIATMTNSRLGIRDNTPDFTLDISHLSGVPTDATGNGLNIENELGLTRWTLYSWSSGNFSMYRDGSLRGTFNGTSGAYTSVSDRRLKKDIQSLPPQMEKIMQLKPTTYQFKTQRNSESYYGLIAQEVMDVYPEMTPLIESKEEGGQDLYGVTYSAFVPVLIAGLQEQQEQIKALQEQNELLIQRLEALEAQKQ